jgi:hypothetical protein
MNVASLQTEPQTRNRKSATRSRFAALPGGVVRVAGLLVLASSQVLTGCVSQSKAEAQAQAAFVAGQQQALARMQQAPVAGEVVRINGQVRQPVLPWVPGMTLGSALLAADYQGPDPVQIFIARAGRAIQVDPKELLQGRDVQLLPGDVVQINTSLSQPQPLQ